MARILVIEDDRSYRDMIVEALVEEGYETIAAEDGAVGIERARAYRPDLVVSDVVMEKADGYQVLSALRSEPVTMGIPVILITGWSSKGGHRQGMAMGADDYLSKPFNATELLQSVKAQLKKKERTDAKQTNLESTVPAGAIGAFLTELDPPLRTIAGFADLLADGSTPLTRNEIADVAQGMRESADRIRRSLENYTVWVQLLQLNDDEAGIAALRAARTEGLDRLVERLVERLADGVGRRGDLQFSLSTGEAAISGPYFERIVGELADNALKFSPVGSPVRVVLAFKADRLGFTITDSGMGMSPESLAEIDAFVQFGRSAYGQRGLGLGLAIARKIAELHGGLLTVRSRPGEGTRVIVELPR